MAKAALEARLFRWRAYFGRMIFAQTLSAFVARENRCTLFRIMR
jgi:hypothetical protein